MNKIIPSEATKSKMAINFEEINQATSNELRRIAEWVEDRTAQESESIERRDNQKTRGDETRLLANFPESKKPFWEDNYHKLECFTCEFSQSTKRDCYNPIKRMKWMTKRIKKEGKTHIFAFCPTCTTGDPWTIHGESNYTLIRLNPEDQRGNSHTTEKGQDRRRMVVPRGTV
jgi:hypothetical protein